jgi:hypothetical protein
MSSQKRVILWVLWILTVALLITTFGLLLITGELNVLALLACIVSVAIVIILTLTFQHSGR